MNDLDHELLNLFIKHNDQYAFERLYHKYKLPLVYFAYGYCQNQQIAEEIVHDTFLKVHRFSKQFDFTKTFKTWLWTICRNTALDHLKSDKSKQHFSLDESFLEFESDDQSALLQLINQATKEQLLQAIESLGADQKQTILLWMNDDFSFLELGEILDRSPGAVKNLLHRAKQNLKQALGSK